MINKYKIRFGLVGIFVMLSLSYYIILNRFNTRAANHCDMVKTQSIDCDKVKESCTRKTGCKCERHCRDDGTREPARGGVAECPSWCCEGRCACHPPCP
jgi:hypothetical protein